MNLVNYNPVLFLKPQVDLSNIVAPSTDFLKLNSYDQTETPYEELQNPTNNLFGLNFNIPEIEKNETPINSSDNFDYSSSKGYNGFIETLRKALPNATDDFKNWALFTAKNESGFNPNAKNPNSTASGYFQFINGTWNVMGGGNKSDPIQLIKNAQTAYNSYIRTIRNNSNIQSWMKKNGYTERAVASGMHYAGIGAIINMAKGSGGVGAANRTLLNNILKGKNYNGK